MTWVSCWRSRCLFLSGPGVREVEAWVLPHVSEVRQQVSNKVHGLQSFCLDLASVKTNIATAFLLSSKSHAKMSVVAHPNWKHTQKRILGNRVHPKLAYYKATTAMYKQFHSSICTQEKCIHMFTKTCTRIYTATYNSPPLSTGVTF